MVAQLFRTPLAAAHEALGARMVPFAGWLMPIQYSGIVAEHLHSRSAAGLFDLSHMGRLNITGSDAETLAQRATTNNVARLDAGAAQYSLICNEDGGVVEDLLVYRLHDEWRLVVNASNRVRVVALLRELGDRLGLDARVEDQTVELGLLGLQGPVSEAVLQPLVEGDLSRLRYYHARWDVLTTPNPRTRTPVLLSRTGYTGEDGFELVVESEQAPAVWEALLADERVRPVGLGARDTLRLEAGMALYGHELTEDVNPFEAGLGRVVRLDKGPFIGGEALRRLAAAPASRKLVGLSFEPGAVPRAGCAVNRNGKQVGEVASGTFSPTLRRPIASAYVRSEDVGPGVELTVTIRGSEAQATVAPLPFVPHRTKLH